MKTLSHLTALTAIAAFAAFTPSVASAQWGFLVEESEITNVTGNIDMDSAEMASNGAGLFAIVDTEGSSADETIVLLDPSQGVGSQGTKIADTASMKTAIDAANGTSTDIDAAAIRIQGIGFDSAGNVIAFIDDGTNPGTLIAVSTTSPFNISVLSTSVDGAPSPIEGGTGLFVDGNTAYVLLEGDFGAAEDAVVAVDLTTIVNDGSLGTTLVAGETALIGAAGQTASDYRHNGAVLISPTQLLVVNSARASSNDDILLIDITTLPGTVSRYIEATEIEAELGATDVGFSAIAYDSINNEIYLANAFGSGASDDGIVIINSVTSPSDVAVTLDDEATVADDIGGTGSNLYLGNGCLAFDAGNNRMVLFSGGTNTEGLASKTVTTSVTNWTILD